MSGTIKMVDVKVCQNGAKKVDVPNDQNGCNPDHQNDSPNF